MFFYSVSIVVKFYVNINIACQHVIYLLEVLFQIEPKTLLGGKGFLLDFV